VSDDLLFGRRWRAQIDTLLLEGFDVRFEITKSLAPKTPNAAELKIWNLNADHRQRLQELERVYVSIEAGYESATSVLFRGDLRDVVSTRENSDWVTTITSDSGRRARKKRIIKSFAPGSSVADVLKHAASALGVRLGNTAQRVVSAKIAGTQASKFFNGYALAGAIDEELDRLARSCNLEWSIQDDELQFLDYGEALDQLAIKLEPESGLIGSPEPGNKGIAEVRCLILPDLYPGRRVQMISEHVRGMYRVETTKHTGSTFGNEWWVDLQLKSEQRMAST
jgi:hypothetical protein